MSVPRYDEVSTGGRRVPAGGAIDQARQILYLASGTLHFCTGQIWRPNGGQTIPR
ncbi:MAG: hypothetical protein QF890_07335 [Myxococcota bacterium]|nr:hypothetical protein [bacterium]MDP6075585.1 hypothetical protein [Myxococcota bacterium]MDP6242707.1 hypothetical protein [Myxococcota bacterium]MDP7074520.1 hypothetical protein [Myxococcota bacterium]MDP7298396.1 hypothetical protein [Myxococcota bacterium]